MLLSDGYIGNYGLEISDEKKIWTHSHFWVGLIYTSMIFDVLVFKVSLYNFINYNLRVENLKRTHKICCFYLVFQIRYYV